MIDKRFGKLVVKSVFGKGSRGISYIVKCDCGKELKMTASMLIGGRLSCGCTVIRHNILASTLRGLKQSNELTYNSWHSMWARCHYAKKKQKCYEGVTICEEWKSFEQFLKDMGPRPSINHSLDRKKPSLGYSKENCRWVTKKFNCANIRRNLSPERNAKVSAGLKKARAEGRIVLSTEGITKLRLGAKKRIGRKLQLCTKCGNKSYLPLCQRCRGLRK